MEMQLLRQAIKTVTMKLISSLKLLRPVCIFCFVALVLILLPCPVIPYWYHRVNRIEHEVKLNDQTFRAQYVSQVENTAKLLDSFNASALNLARALSPSIHGTELSFSNIETRVAPVLFQTLSILPYLSQISYFGLDGLVFSYYMDGDTIFSVYSNSSFVSNSSSKSKDASNYTWYTQPVNHVTGRLEGEAITSTPMNIVNSSWFSHMLNNSDDSASLGHQWNNHQELLFLNAASLDDKGGVVSLGFQLQELSNLFTDANFSDVKMYLASADGQLILQGIPDTRMVVVDRGDSILLQLLRPNSDLEDHIGNVSCKANADGTPNSTIVEVLETKYLIQCSRLEILGVQSVYVLAFPRKGLVSLVHKNSKLALVVLIVMITTMVITIFAFLLLIVRASWREMHLCAALIKQMESTQQAERKHLNRSLAFASANHDVRASLAGIAGLVELSFCHAAPGSDLETNLRQMKTCSNDLMRLLTSILDTSKIEAGKMDLYEEEFNLAELLEDIVDMYHSVGMKKGVDVVLDPCDGSVLKFSHVKGDRSKLQQILWNLLSNAVKFTTEGHISIRALAKKPSLEQSILASQHNGFLNRLSGLFYKSNEALETMKTVQPNPNTVEFVFDVEDTGAGIPKDKQKSVFENYVQVKETAKEQGTGLGLGIVQSLVRLMGGEIRIVDKENGMSGTCFRFNALLTTTDESTISNDNHNQDDIEGQSNASGPSESYHQQHVRFMSMCSPKTRFDGSSDVVLLIKNDERRRVVYNFMASQGIRVSVVQHWESLAHTLKKMKRKLHRTNYSSSGKSDWSSKSERLSKSASHNFSFGGKDVPLSALDGTDNALQLYKRTNNTRGVQNFALILIDTSAGPATELCKVMFDFRNDIRNASAGSFGCQVVWLHNPTPHSDGLNNGGRFEDQGDLIFPIDHIITKPFHGSHLYQVVRFLPEFGGLSPHRSQYEDTPEAEKPISPKTAISSSTQLSVRTRSRTPPTPRRGDIREDRSTSGGEEIRGVKKVTFLSQPGRHEVSGPDDEEPLKGKKVLVVEDSMMLRRVAVLTLQKFGAKTDSCENGKEALDLVCEALEASKILPYDYIFMDCEMPVMDGFEASKMIRKEEISYGVYIPIIALTAHDEGEKVKMMKQAGMDWHLSKSFTKKQLLEAIVSISRKLMRI